MTTRTREQTIEEQTRDHLLRRLGASLPRRASYVEWYRGHGPAPAAPKRYSKAYAHFRSISTNAWSRLVVDSLAQRIKMIGVDVGDDALDLEVWNLLRVNRLDSDQRLVTIDSLTTGVSYLSIWPSQVDPKLPRIVPESSLRTITMSAPADRREIVAALKAWFDEIASEWHATLYTPEAIWKWAAPVDRDDWQKRREDAPETPRGYETLPDPEKLDWTPRRLDDEDWPITNDLGVVPIVALPNRPDVYTPVDGVSEIGDIEPILMRSDKLTLDMMLAAELAAFRQRWATGLDVPKDEEGRPVEPFQTALDRLWVSDSPDARFGDFGATDLGPYLAAIDAQVANISAISRVPSYYLVSPSLVNPPSAEAMRAAEAGLVAKVRDQTVSFGEGYERVVRLACQIAGITIEAPATISIVWADPETRSDAQLADAAVKWKEVGVPLDVIWRRLGATPSDVVEWRQSQAAEAALTALLTPPPTNGATAPVG